MSKYARSGSGVQIYVNLESYSCTSRLLAHSSHVAHYMYSALVLLAHSSHVAHYMYSAIVLLAHSSHVAHYIHVLRAIVHQNCAVLSNYGKLYISKFRYSSTVDISTPV